MFSRTVTIPLGHDGMAEFMRTQREHKRDNEHQYHLVLALIDQGEQVGPFCLSAVWVLFGTFSVPGQAKQINGSADRTQRSALTDNPHGKPG